MKTQINTLQRGHGNKGIIGTSLEIRKEVEASIRTYPTNVDIFVEGMSFSIDIDFQDSEFFESHDEARDWAEERVSEIEDQFGSKIDNYDDIVDALVSAVDRYTK